MPDSVIVYQSSETLDLAIQYDTEIETLEKGKNLRARVEGYPFREVVLRYREKTGEDMDQMVFPWYWPKDQQFLTERGFWVDVFDKEGVGNEPDRTIIITIDRRRLDQLKSGALEDCCLLTRCCLDRLQIRYYPHLSRMVA